MSRKTIYLTDRPPVAIRAGDWHDLLENAPPHNKLRIRVLANKVARSIGYLVVGDRDGYQDGGFVVTKYEHVGAAMHSVRTTLNPYSIDIIPDSYLAGLFRLLPAEELG